MALRDRLYWYRLQVHRVIDGDTVVGHLDLGAGQSLPLLGWPGGDELPYPHGRYRLWGINTPEKKDKVAWQRAKDLCIELVASSTEIKGGKPVVYVRTHKVGGRGRLVVDIYVPQGDAPTVHLNGTLLDEGLCPTYQGKPRTHWWPDGAAI